MQAFFAARQTMMAAMVLLALGTPLALSGCAKEPGDSRPAGTERSDTARRTTPESPQPERPQSKRGTITIEGMAEPIRLDLFDSSPYSFPLPFTTYIPEDIIAEQVPDSLGPAISFVSNFGGRRNAHASMMVVSIPSATNEEQARAVAIRAATRTGRKERRVESGRYGWAIAEHPYQSVSPKGTPLVGIIALARHGDRYFYLQIEYPPEYAEGFGPRAQIIFDEWQWSDEATPSIATPLPDGPAEIDPDSDTASVGGRIARIERPVAGEGAGSILGNLVLEDPANPDTNSNRTIIHVAPTTAVGIERNGSLRQAAYSDLKRGQLVRTFYVGAVPAIYPMRVVAREVVIVER